MRSPAGVPAGSGAPPRAVERQGAVTEPVELKVGSSGGASRRAAWPTAAGFLPPPHRSGHAVLALSSPTSLTVGIRLIRATIGAVAPQPYDPETADADLTHLRLAGSLDDLAALVLCRPYNFTHAQNEQLHEALMVHVAHRKYPVIARLEGGHTDPLPTLPLGVTVDVDGTDLVIRETAVTAR